MTFSGRSKCLVNPLARLKVFVFFINYVLCTSILLERNIHCKKQKLNLDLKLVILNVSIQQAKRIKRAVGFFSYDPKYLFRAAVYTEYIMYTSSKKLVIVFMQTFNLVIIIIIARMLSKMILPANLEIQYNLRASYITVFSILDLGSIQKKILEYKFQIE